MSLKICSVAETTAHLKSEGLPGSAVSADAALSFLSGLATRSANARQIKHYIEEHAKPIRVLFIKDCPWIQIVFDAPTMAVLVNTDVQVYNKAATSKTTLEIPLDLILYHELGHAKQFLENPTRFKEMEEEADKSGDLKRDGYYAAIENDNLARHEWPICDDINLPRRSNYTDFCPMGDVIKKKRAQLNWKLLKKSVLSK